MMKITKKTEVAVTFKGVTLFKEITEVAPEGKKPYVEISVYRASPETLAALVIAGAAWLEDHGFASQPTVEFSNGQVLSEYAGTRIDTLDAISTYFESTEEDAPKAA